MKTTLDFFLKKNFNEEAISTLELLQKSGSARKYYRFKYNQSTFILTENENVEENKTFLYFTNHFTKYIDNLPEIISVSDDFVYYVQTDLGTTSLMDILISNSEKAFDLYKKSIEQLVKMQILGSIDLDYSKCFSYPEFNYLLVLRDLFSFKNYFLNVSKIDFNHGKLLTDFENFAKKFQQIPYKGFVFRDFQSRNILIYKNEPFFIDYQGGLHGPVLYDLVSLIWQAKANLSAKWKEDLYDFYVKKYIENKQEDVNGIEFRRAYELCVIERVIQVLGTYGFRGLIERKSHFMESIEFGLRNIRDILEFETLKNFPELHGLMKKLAQEEFINDTKKRINER